MAWTCEGLSSSSGKANTSTCANKTSDEQSCIGCISQALSQPIGYEDPRALLIAVSESLHKSIVRVGWFLPNNGEGTGIDTASGETGSDTAWRRAKANTSY